MMDDFIFGTLATDALRRARVDGLRAGVTHQHQRSPRQPIPGQPTNVYLSVGPTCPGERAWLYWTTDGSDPEGGLGLAKNGNVLELDVLDETWDTILWGYIRRFVGQIPAQPLGTLVRYRLSAFSAAQGEVFADGGAYEAIWVDDHPAPEWSRDAVVYQIFPDRFWPGEGRAWLKPEKPAGFYGGTLRGITERLGHVAHLGFNTLWLTPIFPSPSHHGYDAMDLFEVEPRLGSKEDLRFLLDKAHGLGMRVLLDFVPNHWSWLHKTFQDARQNAHSQYRDWYTFTQWPDEYETFFGVRELPQLNLRNAAVRQHVLDAAVYWLEFGVDGYRVDYAIGPSADFWAAFRQATRRAKPDCWTFGEVVDPPDVQLAFEGGLDGCLDFMLLEALRQSLAFGRWNADRLGSFLQRHQAYFPVTFSRPSFLDNHDMNRFLWAAGGDMRRLRLAALCQFTLPGAPVVYYGTETGLSQERDVRQGRRGLPEEARLPMNWERADRGLMAFYRLLVALRKEWPALRRGSQEIVSAQGDVLMYRRTLDDQDLLVVLNLGESEQVLRLPFKNVCPLLVSEPGCVVGNPMEGAWLRMPGLAGGCFLIGPVV
jgi:glycosidase